MCVCIGDDEDECNDDGCPTGGICVARGNFATRKCLMSGLYPLSRHSSNMDNVCVY